MSTKTARGTKRVCQNCSNKFYDLSRDPITCPICNTVFQHQTTRPKAALVGNAADDDEDDEVIAAPAAAVETVSLDEVAAEEEEADIPDLEDTELVEIEDDEAELGDDDETFIEVEDDDDDGDEVTGIVSGSRDEEDV